MFSKLLGQGKQWGMEWQLHFQNYTSIYILNKNCIYSLWRLTPLPFLSSVFFTKTSQALSILCQTCGLLQPLMFFLFQWPSLEHGTCCRASYRLEAYIYIYAIWIYVWYVGWIDNTGRKLASTFIFTYIQNEYLKFIFTYIQYLKDEQYI